MDIALRSTSFLSTSFRHTSFRFVRNLQIMVIASIILVPIAAAHASDLSITGYYKNFFVAFDAPAIAALVPLHDEPLIGQVTNRLRLNLSSRLTGRLTADLSYDLIPRVQDPSLFGVPPNFAGSGFPTYRLADLDSRLYPGEKGKIGSFGLFQNLDRALLTLTTRVADFYLGRQAIAWGSARAVNPTDILSPFTFDELDTEDRRGVDAVRVRIPVGRLEEIDAGYVFGDDFDFDESAFFLRGTFRARRTDVSPMLVGFRENLLIGADLTRAFGGASGWLEAAYVFIDALGGRVDGSDEDYFRATVGADYAPTGELYTFLEYHFSRAGSGSPGEYTNLFQEPAFTDGAVYLLGRHYLIPGFSYQITPLLVLGGQFLANLEDPSLLAAPTLEYNFAEDIYFSGGAFIGLGKGPRLEYDELPDGPIRMRSEFGAYTDLYYTSFRIYF